MHDKKELAFAGNLVLLNSKCTIIVHDLKNKNIVDSSFFEINEIITPIKNIYLKPFIDVSTAFCMVFARNEFVCWGFIGKFLR